MTEDKAVNPLTVPSNEYNNWVDEWKRSLAVVSGDAAVKRYDDGENPVKILAPLSLDMDPMLYTYYKQRGELPGYASSQRRTVVGALLRKKVGITLPEGFDKAEEAKDWITNNLHIGGGTLMSLMKDAFEDDLITANTWLHLDMNQNKEPVVEVLPAEAVISVVVGAHPRKGFGNLVKVVVRKQEVDEDNSYYYRYQIHEINADGNYQVRIYRDGEDDIVEETVEPIIPTYVVDGNKVPFQEILVFPVDGTPSIQNPFLGDFVTREISLYNLLTARNHLLIMSGSLTPIITGNVNPDSEATIKGSGLGSVWTLPDGANIKILETPTGSLSAFDSAIESTRTDLRNLGARQLMKDSRTSGVAAEIQNSPYSATLSSLSRTYSNTLRKLIAYAVNWKYRTNFSVSEFDVQLSNDLSRSAIGDNAVATVTAAYNINKLPRDVWVQVLKDNSIIPQDYDDEGFEETEVTDEPTDQ